MNKQNRQEKYEQIRQNCMFITRAKDDTLHALIELGKKMGPFRYLMIAVLFVFLFVYHASFHFFVQMRMRERLARAMAAAMSVVLIITSIDLTAFAMTQVEDEPLKVLFVEDTYEAVLDELGEWTGYRIEVPFGTALEDIEFPTDIRITAGTEVDEEDEEVLETPEEPEIPVVDEPAEDEPVVDEPAVDEPVVDEPAVDEPVVDEPAEDEPAVDEPVVDEPAEDEPAVDEPAEDEPAVVDEPAADDTVTEDGEDGDLSARTVEVDMPLMMSEPDGEGDDIEVITVDDDDDEVIAPDDENDDDDEVIDSDDDENDDTDEVIDESINDEESDEEDKPDTSHDVEETIIEEVELDIPVTWECEEYDAMTAGEYVFTAVLPDAFEDYTLDWEGVSAPTLIVKVLEPLAFEQIVVVDDIKITMSAVAGVFPENAVLAVTKVEDEESIAKIEEAIQDTLDDEAEEDEVSPTVKKTITFDIVVLNEEGDEIQPDIPEGMSAQEAVTVTFKKVVPQLETELTEEEIEEEAEQVMDVFYVDDAMENAEQMVSSVEGDDLSFSPEHFSYYVCTNCTHSSFKSVSSWSSLYKAIYNKTGEIKVKLTSDITIKKLPLYSNSDRIYIHKGQTVLIDLNGYDIRSYTGKPAVELKKGTLEIHDRDGDGTISAADGSQVIYVSGSSGSRKVNLYGGTIRRAGDESWGIDVVSKATINIKGGYIEGGFSCGIWASSAYNTEIYMENGCINGASRGIYFGGGGNNGLIKMTGGTISNSSSAGIYNGGTTLTMSGGTITGNGSYKAYGVQVTGANAEINLSGNVQFANNRAADIYVGSSENNYINVTGALTGSDIGIATSVTPTNDNAVRFTQGITSAEKFYSKASSANGVWKHSTENYLVTGPMGNKTITAEMVFVETYPASNTDGKVGKIALGTAIPVASTDDGSTTKDISSTVKFNTPMTFTATLVDSKNYEFKGWRISGKTEFLSTSPVYTFDAKDNLNLEVVFARKLCEVSVAMSEYSVTRGEVSITGYKIGTVPQTISTTESTQNKVYKLTGKFEIGSTLTITATPKTVSNVTYEFYQWNDGVATKGNDGVATRTVTVAGDAVYNAQFKNPAPDANATGNLFSNVKPISIETPPAKDTKLLLIGGGESMDTVGEGGSNNNTRTYAVAGLPANHAYVTVLGSKAKSGDSYWSGNYTNKINKTSFTHDGKTIYTMTDEHATKHANDTTTGTGGIYVDVTTRGPEFDTCDGLINYTTHGGCNAWHFWCSGSYVQGGGPYNAYSYDEMCTFKAGDISATYNEIVYTEDKNSVERIDLDVTIKVKNTGGTETVYTITNLIYEDETINYAEGDKSIELNLGGVAFTYVLPEATVVSTDENGVETQKHYATLQEAIKAANTGDTIEIIGNAVSEIVGETNEEGETVEGIIMKPGVSIESFDGTKITTGKNSATVKASSDGTIELVNGTLTATPATNKDVEVSVNGATVSSESKITVSTDESGKGQVSTSTPGADITISPDGNPNHTVVFDGCVANKEYGINAGKMTTENQVIISSGTEYKLTVPSTGEAGGTVIKTDSSNTGKTTVTTPQDSNGNDTIVIDSTNANDSVTVTTPDNKTHNYTTSKNNTQLVITENSNNVVLEKGGVNVPTGGSVTLPSGDTITNTSGGSGDITVSADGTGKESVVIPGGGSANIGGTDISVPAAKEGKPSNLPVGVELNGDGTLDVTAQAGNSVTIGGQNYEIGDYNATFEVDPEAEEGAIPVVKEGTVVLQPGQSITDSNGVTYTNPPVKEGEEGKPLEITMTEGQKSEVNVKPDQSFEYTPAGSNNPIEYSNPGNSDAAFIVGPNGDVSLGSDISLGEGDDVDVSFDGNDRNIVIPDGPDGNNGNVNVDPIEGTITIDQAGDSVIIDGVKYTASEAGTVIKPGKDGVELESGAVNLGSGSGIVANGTMVENTGSGSCTVGQKKDANNNPTGEITVNVPQNGSFSMTDPGSGQSASFTNPSAGAEYTIDSDGNLVVPGGDSISFTQNGVKTEVNAPDDSAITLVPSEDGVAITAPAGKDVTINGTTYDNTGSDELVIVVDKKGKPVLIEGETTLPADGNIQLPGGDVIKASGGNVTVDGSGNISMGTGATTTITKDGKNSSYTAVGGTVNLQYDPETGIPTIGKDSTGSVELGANSKLEVIYNTIAETEETFAEDEKAIITNTGSAPARVDKDGNIQVPKGGSVTIDSEVKTDDSTVVPVQNKVSVPSDAQNGSVTMKPKTDGTVDVTLKDSGDSVNVNGMEYTAGAPDTKINVSENGSTLEAGSVSLDGGKNPKESINVNDTCVTSSGAAGTTVTTTKNADGTVKLEVSENGKFDLSIPGKKDSAVTFTNPTGEDASYTVGTDGSIALNNGNSIGFSTGEGNIIVSGTGAEEPATSDIAVKVTEKGVQITAPAGTDIKIGNKVYENTGDSKLIIVVDSNGNPILISGSAKLPGEAGGITLPDGNTVEGNGDKVSVDTNGNVTIPNGATATITTPDGSKNTYKATTDNVKLTTDGEDVPKLSAGSVELGNNSSLKLNDGTIITGTTSKDSAGGDTLEPTVSADGSISVPKGSGVILTKEVTDGDGVTQTISTPICSDGNNTGKVNISKNDEGKYVVEVETSGNKATVGDNTYETIGDGTKITVSDSGNELTAGGVNLDGGSKQESIIVNGTEVTNVGDGTISVQKTDNNKSQFEVAGGGQFELAVPGVPGSGVIFTNPSEESAEYTIDSDGNIALGEDSKIQFAVGNKDYTIGGGDGVSMKMTDAGVELTVPAGKTVTIGDVEYTAKDGNALQIVIDAEGNKILKSGTTDIPKGDSVFVQYKDKEKIEISKINDNKGSDEPITVTHTGIVNAKADDTIQIGDGTYTSNDSDFVLDLDKDTEEVVVKEGSNISVTNGNVTFVTDDTTEPAETVSVSTEGSDTVCVKKTVDDTTGNKTVDVTVPAGGNATITGPNGNPIEIIVPENESDDSEDGDGTTTDETTNIEVDSDGNLSIEMKEGQKITIGGIVYEASQDGTLKINGSTGKMMDDSTIGTTEKPVKPTIDPDSFNKSNYEYTLEPGESVTVGDVTYTAPEGSSVTLKGNPDGNPIIDLDKGSKVTIKTEDGKDYTYTSSADGTQFVANAPDNITLKDSSAEDGSSSLVIPSPSEITVDGNKIKAEGTGNGYVITKTPDGNKIDVRDNVDVAVELGNKTPLAVNSNDSVTVNGAEYTAPSGGMILSGNGKANPTVEIPKKGEAVTVDGTKYTAGSNDTKLIINGKNNVTLVDNGQADGSNSSVEVDSPATITIDGNTIQATGNDGGFTVSKTENGNSIDIKDGTKVNVTMGSQGSNLTINEKVSYNGQETNNSTTITPSKGGTTVVIDKTQQNEYEEYIPSISSGGSTIMTPVKDENGNIIGFTTTLPAPKPPVSGDDDDDDDDSSSGTVVLPETVLPEVPVEVIPETNLNTGLGNVTEDGNTESEEVLGDETVDGSNPATGLETEEMLQGEISGENATVNEEPDVVVIETTQEAEGIEVVKDTNVSLGQGEVIITAVSEAGRLSGELGNILTACFTEEELGSIQNGVNTEIRLTVVSIKKETHVSKTDKKAIEKAIIEYAGAVDGLELGTLYEIVIERKIGDSDWETLSVLQEDIDVTIEIPEEIRKEGRTYFAIRNHEGECTILEDKDDELYTITISTGLFSTYAITYTDAAVAADVDIASLPTVSSDAPVWPWMLVMATIAMAFVLIIVAKKRKEQK